MKGHHARWSVACVLNSGMLTVNLKFVLVTFSKFSNYYDNSGTVAMRVGHDDRHAWQRAV